MDEENARRVDDDVIDASAEPVENERRMDERASENRNPTTPAKDELVPLFEEESAEKFRTRWLAIQSKFVDDPSESVKQADTLVADVIEGITSNFADRRGTLEQQWRGGDTTSTEDLRIALKQYRSFFNRLLSLES
jgi:hypothetical protein